MYLADVSEKFFQAVGKQPSTDDMARIDSRFVTLDDDILCGVPICRDHVQYSVVCGMYFSVFHVVKFSFSMNGD